jgi:hypothetical protein
MRFKASFLVPLLTLLSANHVLPDGKGQPVSEPKWAQQFAVAQANRQVSGSFSPKLDPSRCRCRFCIDSVAERGRLELPKRLRGLRFSSRFTRPSAHCRRA